MITEIKQRFLKKVKGPVFPVPIPFSESGEIDYDGLRRYIEFLLAQGAQTVMVTVGTSRFDLLTIQEMKKVNKIVAEAASGKAITIVTTPTKGPTSQAIDFVKHAATVGADGILAVYPDRYYSDDDIYRFFKDIAESCSIGILIHLMEIPAGRTGLGPKVHYSPNLANRIVAIDNVVGIKEESHNQELSRQYCNELSDRAVVIGGAGGMKDYMTKHHWGQQAYLVGIGNFAPKIEIDFYEALNRKDNNKAEKIIFKYEKPFFEVAVKAGWHLALKEALAFFNLMEPWERLPLSRISTQAKNRITDNLRSKKWMPTL